MEDILRELKESAKAAGMLVDSITSPIAINDCANVVLALGAKPIMAEHPKEVAEITAISKALTVSYANITDARLESINISGKTAFEKGIPSVIDAVGVTCSPMRLGAARRFIESFAPYVIKGNASEIRALAGCSYENAGIDVAGSDFVSRENEPRLLEFAELVKEYAVKTGAVVVATGEVDVISNGEKVAFVYNGCRSMADITGTGCMLNCIIGVYLAALSKVEKATPFEAALLSTLVMGIAGQSADVSKGLGSFHIDFLDKISLLTYDDIKTKAKYKLI